MNTGIPPKPIAQTIIQGRSLNVLALRGILLSSRSQLRSASCAPQNWRHVASTMRAARSRMSLHPHPNPTCYVVSNICARSWMSLHLCSLLIYTPSSVRRPYKMRQAFILVVILFEHRFFSPMTTFMCSRELHIQLCRLLTWYFSVCV